MIRTAKKRNRLDGLDLPAAGDNGNTTTITTGVIRVPEHKQAYLELEIQGISRLVTHRWSEKAKREIQEKQGGRAAPKKEKRDPEIEWREACYNLHNQPGKYGIPAIAFKKAMVNACSNVANITKVLSRGAFFVVGVPQPGGFDLVPIVSKKDPVRRDDFVRIGMGKTDIRYRPEWLEWGAILTIIYNPRIITPEQVIHLSQEAGMAMGVCENRPEKSGDSWGRWKVVKAVANVGTPEVRRV